MTEISSVRRIELKGMIEAMIFSSDSPVAIKTLKDIFDASDFDGQRLEIEGDEIRQIIEELNADYTSAGRSYRIIEIAGGYQYATLPKFSTWVGKIFREKTKRRLSQSAIESLAIIAYKQPVTKPDLEFIRGVDCDYVLKTLLERNLVAIIGRATTPGRPLLYGTTQDFLRHFGLSALSDLPKPREIEELLGETELEVEKRLLEEQQLAEEEESTAPRKEKEEGPRFRKPIIPKKRTEPVEQLPLPIAQSEPVTAEAEVPQGGEDGGGDTAVSEQPEHPAGAPPEMEAERTAEPQASRIEENAPGLVPIPEEQTGEAEKVLEEISSEEHIEALAAEAHTTADEEREPQQEQITWEQIPKDHNVPEAAADGGNQQSIDELHANVELVRERGWTKFKHRVQDLLKRLFG